MPQRHKNTENHKKYIEVPTAKAVNYRFFSGLQRLPGFSVETPTTKAVGYRFFFGTPTTKAVGYRFFFGTPTTKAVGSEIVTKYQPTALVVGNK